jgi:hypothetical protein
MVTTDELAVLLATAVAAVCGAAAGRVFAVEGENRRTSILAAAYCGAGAGLLSATLLAFAVTLITTLPDPAIGITESLARAGEAFAVSMLWGVAGGAAGGLAIGVLVAVFKTYAPR